MKKSENPFEYARTVSLVDFLINLGINTASLVDRTHLPNGARCVFFEGATGDDGRTLCSKVSHSVEELTADLSVSWVTPKDGGAASYLVHPKGRGGNVTSQFSRTE